MMVQSPVPESSCVLPGVERVASHPSSLIDQLEWMLNSPGTFTPSTPTSLLSLIDKLPFREADEEVQARIARVVKWSQQLDDAVSAAHARQVITAYLKEVTSWPEWSYSVHKKQVQVVKNRVDEIKQDISELPIEWLKSRVTELRKQEGELHPPAYLTIHITFSLLPPLSTLSAQLQLYTARFRVFDLSLQFLSLISTLKSFLSIPFAQRKQDEGISSTEALALSVEAGLLLDRMIDISVEEKSTPIPEPWIEEFERIEGLVARMAQEQVQREETPSPDPLPGHESLVGSEEGSPVTRRDRTRESLVESVFSSPERRMDDSMSSIEDELPEHLRIKHGRFVEDELEERLDLKEVEGPESRDEIDEGDRDAEGLSLEDELGKDDEKIFDNDKEYHAISSPPQEETSTDNDNDHSPFLHRIIAELENLELLESSSPPESPLLESHSPQLDSPPNEPNEDNVSIKQEDEDPSYPFHVTNHAPKNAQDPDIDALYHEIQNGPDSDDDEIIPPSSLHHEIRTSSPISETAELNYAELESDEDDEPALDSDLEGETRVGSGILDTIEDDVSDEDEFEGDKTERLARIDLNPFDSPNKLVYPAFSVSRDGMEIPVSTSSTIISEENNDNDLLSPHENNFDIIDIIDSDNEEDSDSFSPEQTITLPPTTPLSPRKRPHLTPPPISSPLHKSHLHTTVTAIAHSHPSVTLVPQTATFRPFSRTEYATYTLHPRQRAHSRASSVSSEGEARKVEMGGVNLYVRILSDRCMVRVGGGWVDLDHYLREYIGKREVSHRRRSGSVEHQIQSQSPKSPVVRDVTPISSPSVIVSSEREGAGWRSPSLSPGIEGYEFLDIEERGQFGRRVSTPIQRTSPQSYVTSTIQNLQNHRAGTPVYRAGDGRCVSSLGIRESPPRQGGRNTSFEMRRSVSPGLEEGGGAAGGNIGVGIGRGSVTRRVFVRRK